MNILTAERDELRKRNEQLGYSNKLASKSEARKVECIDQLVEYIDKLEAECDELEIKHQNDYDAWQLQMDKLQVERERYRDNMLAQTRRVAELTAEVEQLKRANRTQADSFRKLEADYARACLELEKAKRETEVGK